MNEYIATFHTHAGAIVSHRNLSAKGVSAKMMPVPRKLSSSCGTCIRYQAENEMLEQLNQDFEALYAVEGDNKYRKIADGDEC